MQEVFINYLPELIGGIIIAFVSFWFTRLNEKAKAKIQLKHKQEQFEHEKEKIKVKYDAKLKEQQLKFNHEKDILEKKHEQEIEKYNMESQAQDLSRIFSGEYNIKEISNQMGGLEELMKQAKEMDKRMKSGTFKNANHPANKRR